MKRPALEVCDTGIQGTERPLAPSAPTTAPGTQQLWVAPSGILLPLPRLCLGALEPLQESVRILCPLTLPHTVCFWGQGGVPRPARGEGLGYQNPTVLCTPLALAQSLQKVTGGFVGAVLGVPLPCCLPRLPRTP